MSNLYLLYKKPRQEDILNQKKKEKNMNEYYISYGHVEGRRVKTDANLEDLVLAIHTESNAGSWVEFTSFLDKTFAVKASEIYSIEQI